MLPNFLNICPMNTIDDLDGQFEGIISPKNYSYWSEVDPVTLFIEGLHQFCVRITLLNSGLSNSPGARVPSQIKSLIFFESPDYSDQKIYGSYIAMGTFYLITFTALSVGSNKIAEGKIYIANT